jgi:sulfur carrier protein ThiS
MTETKTVAELLIELNLTKDHVVLVEGQRMELNDILNEHDSVVVLPIIAGG